MPFKIDVLQLQFVIEFFKVESHGVLSIEGFVLQVMGFGSSESQSQLNKNAMLIRIKKFLIPTGLFYGHY